MSGNANEDASPAEQPEVPSTGGSANAPNSQQQVASGNANQRAATHSRGNHSKGPQDTKSFKGETLKMNGHVFQLHAERKNKAQFTDTMEALRIYASTAYKNDIESLTVLFMELEEPTVAEPQGPEETVTFDDDGVSTTSVSKFQETIYNERIKQWIRDERSLKQSIRSIYNIVWGQCSKLMKDKVTMMKDFDSTEAKGDVTALLKEIRIIGLQIETNTSVYDALDEAHAMYYAYKQEPGESNAKHLRNFKSIVAAVEHLGGGQCLLMTHSLHSRRN